MAREVNFRFQSLSGDPGARATLGKIPRGSGVFRIFDLNGNLILLEKTHNLGQRLDRFYSEAPPPGGLDLRDITGRIDFCRTHSPFETRYLLYRERRHWFPGSWRRMKTFPKYHFLEIDMRARFPRLTTGSRPAGEIRSFGPLRSRSELEDLRTTLERVFRIRPCEYDIRGDDPYPDCLYFQMHTCSRPCNADISRRDYREDIERAIAFIEGDEGRLLKPLISRMETLAAETRFEDAEEVRIEIDRIRRAMGDSRTRLFEIGHFDFVVVLRARSVHDRKIAVIRSGQIQAFEEHAVAALGETVEASLSDPARQATLEPDRTYDEFSLAVGFLLRPLSGVQFFPLGEPAETAAAIATEISR